MAKKEPKSEEPTKPKTVQVSSYVILTQAESGNWAEVATVQAASREAAIKKALNDAVQAAEKTGDSADGVYRAVAASSWGTPVEVKTETKTVVTFS